MSHSTANDQVHSLCSSSQTQPEERIMFKSSFSSSDTFTLSHSSLFFFFSSFFSSLSCSLLLVLFFFLLLHFAGDMMWFEDTNTCTTEFDTSLRSSEFEKMGFCVDNVGDYFRSIFFFLSSFSLPCPT